MTREGLVLGVDGGNTKTLAMAALLDGTVVGVGRGGCSDIYGAGSAEAALAEIDRATAAALAGVGGPAEVGTAVFSLAGADWPEDFEFLEEALARRGFRHAAVYNDAVAALRAGSPDFSGVSIVCGTGAATAARSPAGALWHTSWWQEPQGARQLGQKALSAVYRANLGIDPPTSLTAAILQAYASPTAEDLLHRFSQRGAVHPRTDLAAIALVEQAECGDEVALRIVRSHGVELARFGLAAARKVGLTTNPFRTVLAGTVALRSCVLRESIERTMKEHAPNSFVVIAQLAPVHGALLLALEAAGVSVGPQVERRVAQAGVASA